MDIVIERACGMDAHKDNITACIMKPEGKEIQPYSTKTVKPIVNLLEAEDIEFLVVNNQHMNKRNHLGYRSIKKSSKIFRYCEIVA